MFRDCSRLIQDNPSKLHCGCTMADLDGDGAQELFLCGYGGSNVLLQWQAGQLVDITPPELADIGRRALACTAADFDGNGQEELYILNTDTFGGAKRFSDRLAGRSGGRWYLDTVDISDPMNAGAVAAMDRMGSGQYGFLLATEGGPLRLIERGMAGRFRDAAPEIGLAVPGLDRCLFLGPILSDRMDVLALGDGLSRRIFVQQQDGSFRDCATETLGERIRSNPRGLACVDYDQDGRLDLVQVCSASPNRLLLATEDLSFPDAALADFARPGDLRAALVADFDNCGYEEILLVGFGEPNRLFGYRKGSWRQIEAGDAAEPAGFGTGAACGDIDGDGQLELVITHGERVSQPVSLFKARDCQGRSLRVQPLTPAGAPARGAWVQVEQAGRRMTRILDAGGGSLSQSEPFAHFGLGQETFPCSVRIRWPGGAERVLGPIEPGSVLRVPHPSPENRRVG